MSQSNTRLNPRPGSDVMTGKFFLFLMKHDWFLIAERQIPNVFYDLFEGEIWAMIEFYCTSRSKLSVRLVPWSYQSNPSRWRCHIKFRTSHIPKGGLEPPFLWLGKATELCNRCPIQNVHRMLLSSDNFNWTILMCGNGNAVCVVAI